MFTAKKRSDSKSFLKTIPPDADPFASIKSARSSASVSSSSGSVVVLWIFLFFHTLVVLFCLFILVQSSISKVTNFRWFCKRLYIRDTTGQKVYKSPLYMFNAGILLTVLQLLSSASSQGYIWIQTKTSLSSDCTLQNNAILLAALMNIFETLCYWTMSHCFLVTIYLSRGFHRKMKTGAMRWISPPVFFNFLFTSFPICAVLLLVFTCTWMATTHKHLFGKISELMQASTQASSTWKQLDNGAHQSVEQKARTSQQLLNMQKKIGEEMAPLIENWVSSLHFSIIITLVLICITGVVFILMCCLLVKSYYLEGTRSSGDLPPSSDNTSLHRFHRFRSSRFVQSGSSNPSSSLMLRLNKQFTFLLLRAFAALLSIITQIISLILALIKTRDAAMNKNWRGVLSWLTTTGGAWSAIPIAFQCWRLYADQHDFKFTSNSSVGSRPSLKFPGSRDVEAEVLSIKLKPGSIQENTNLHFSADS